MRELFSMAVLLSTLLLSACSGPPQSGPVEVTWDRDACERCRMVLSDRHHSAQIRYYPTGAERSRVQLFDDIGCALIWLEEQPWRDDPRTEIWVTDHLTGDWIDARKASYMAGQVTPMEYGLGAQSQSVEGGLDFAGAKRHIFEVEDRFNVHSSHLVDKLREQAAQRRAWNPSEHEGGDR